MKNKFNYAKIKTAGGSQKSHAVFIFIPVSGKPYLAVLIYLYPAFSTADLIASSDASPL